MGSITSQENIQSVPIFLNSFLFIHAGPRLLVAGLPDLEEK